jgi:hypothetical protein
MNDIERIQLQKMISEHNVTDQTQLMRKLKHSGLIRNDVKLLLNIKQQMNKDECIQKCSFLYEHYTDIFNKIFKNEINIDLFYKFLIILEDIENDTIDQHLASFQIGKILKELYIDSALKLSNNNDNNNNDDNDTINDTINDISWNEYKKKNI